MRSFLLIPACCVVLCGKGGTTSSLVTGINDASVLNAAASPALQPVYQGAAAPVNGTAVGTPVGLLVDFTTPNNTPGLYSTTDVNLDGVVKYTGSGNDRDPILVNVGSTTPNNVRVQQLP